MRVLSIDGGGMRGFLPALVLRDLEHRAGCPAAELFDLIVGTSTGGIIGIGLAVGKRADELADFYPRYGQQIFQRSGPVPKVRLLPANIWAKLDAASRQLGSAFGGNQDLGGNAGYVPDGLNSALKEILGDTRLSQVDTHLVATTYDANTDCPVVLSSRDAGRSADYDLPLRDVARATSAAPTFSPRSKRRGLVRRAASSTEVSGRTIPLM
jgi:uncharacterized protein